MKKSVLFVDDHQALCRLSCDILRQAGYDAVPAYSAAEALQTMESTRFDLVVTDIRMEGMGGVDLARAIRRKTPEIPIIAVTGYGHIEAREINVCIEKGGLFPALLKQVRECLQASKECAPTM